MEDSQIHYRNILLFKFHAGETAAEARQDLCEVYGEAAITVAECEKWFKQFRGGNFNLEDSPGTKTVKD